MNCESIINGYDISTDIFNIIANIKVTNTP
jgi:hypothetical protein